MSGLKYYANFSGRTRRKDYWIFILSRGFLLILITIIGFAIGGEAGGYVLSFLFSTLNAIPYLAITTRRLHDVGKSGWWQLLGLLPVVGWIWLLVKLFLTNSQPGTNKYGPNPKE